MKTENDQPNENTEVNNTGLANVFSLFVGHDELRQEMHKPFEINGKVYATDAVTLVRCNKTECDFEIGTPDIVPNCKGVIPIENCREIIKISREQFGPLETEDEYKYIGQDVECNTCYGDGVVEWEYQHWKDEFDCPSCNGSGCSQQKQRVKTGGKTFDHSLVKVNDSYFDANIFYKLLKVRDILGGEIIMIHQLTELKPALFKVGVCEILLAPVYFNADNNNAVLNIG